MKIKAIKTLNDLRQHQEVLKLKLDMQGKELTRSWEHAKTHSFKMLWKEVNPLKGNKAVNLALEMIQPGLLPVIAEVVKGGVKGNPVNLKVLGTTAKYAVATLGIKWLRKWLDVKQSDQERDSDTDETEKQ